MAEESSQEYIQVPFDRSRPYRWSTGKYLGKLYAEAKDNKRLVTNRCRTCGQLLWPPKKVCGRCKAEAGEDWTDLGSTGSVVQYTYLVVPMWNPHMGEKWANPHPTATILMDSGAYIVHFLEETDPQKLKSGMRVQAVWREKEEERGEGLGDILYFRTIEEQEASR